ncbi:hypothetical protein [Streptomyces triticirhizae]|uniref:Uncharacterized protein n=1 Tax=Streptomyces triticirhizae TaxID=2483353 RepID=A0A3M2MHI4_9ACTN|nr:hypothetical protein [Streptomyces triticirhizae]RMI46728.1 hypothetical protein EBN88_00395 [Streptomyces triticirhizae]
MTTEHAHHKTEHPHQPKRRPYRCSRFTKIKSDYEAAAAREEESAGRRTDHNRHALRGNAHTYKRRMAAALSSHLARCRLCG